MTDEQRQSLRAALAAHYKTGAELLMAWESAVSPRRVAKVVQRQAFGQRLGLLLQGPEDAEVMCTQVVLTYGKIVAEVIDEIDYNLASHILSTHEDDGLGNALHDVAR